MNDHWRNRLAHFNEMPIVNVFGVVNKDQFGWSSLSQKWPIEPEDIGHSMFNFDVWRVANGEVNTTRIHVTAIISYKEWNSFAGFSGRFRSAPVFHIKAKVARNPEGFQEILFVEWVGPATEDTELNEMHRQLTEPVILNLPPLPELRLDTYDGSWKGTIALPSWEGFTLQSEPNNASHRGTGFQVSIEGAEMPAVRLGYRGVPPSLEQVAAYVYLTDNDRKVRDAVLQAILDNYSQWQADFGGDYEYMPDVTHLEDLHSLLQLRELSINSAAKEGYAYVYFSLDPNWDIEHGLAAITHKNRVVAVGDHDSIWQVIERDAEAS